MEITKELGESCAFTGGNEVTPTVTIVKASPPFFSLQDSEEKVLSIRQGKDEIIISARTLQSILNWAGG